MIFIGCYYKISMLVDPIFRYFIPHFYMFFFVFFILMETDANIPKIDDST